VKRFRKRLLCTLLALAGMVATAAPTQAGSMFVSGFEGSVQETLNAGPAQNNPNLPNYNPYVYISYAVVNKGTAGAGSFLSTIGGPSNATGQYVYLYEISNTSARSVGNLQLVNMNPAVVIDQGGTTGYAFQNNNTTTVAPGSTNANGGATAFNNTSTFSNSFATANGLVPLGQNTNDAPFSTGFEFGSPASNNSIPAGGYSALVYFTSNYAPTFGQGTVSDGLTFGSFAPNDVPYASPEPTSMAMMGLGVFGLGGWAGWRRRFRKTSDLS